VGSFAYGIGVVVFVVVVVGGGGVSVDLGRAEGMEKDETERGMR